MTRRTWPQSTADPRQAAVALEHERASQTTFGGRPLRTRNSHATKSLPHDRLSREPVLIPLAAVESEDAPPGEVPEVRTGGCEGTSGTDGQASLGIRQAPSLPRSTRLLPLDVEHAPHFRPATPPPIATFRTPAHSSPFEPLALPSCASSASPAAPRFASPRPDPPTAAPLPPVLPALIYLACRGRGVQREAVDPPSSFSTGGRGISGVGGSGCVLRSGGNPIERNTQRGPPRKDQGREAGETGLRGRRRHRRRERCGADVDALRDRDRDLAVAVE